ncbi:MAG: hypothetical protein IPG72_10255 [Ardenticatenales bacterium]|nr:hypothetical protein [Ardenticatenales bacterium]
MRAIVASNDGAAHNARQAGQAAEAPRQGGGRRDRVERVLAKRETQPGDQVQHPAKSGEDAEQTRLVATFGGRDVGRGRGHGGHDCLQEMRATAWMGTFS